MLELIAFSKANVVLTKNYKKIFNHSISYYDFKTKLRSSELSEEEISKIISFFIEDGYLDDKDFVNKYQEIYEKNKGINKFKLFLEKNHIPVKLINNAINKYQENIDAIYSYANKYLKSHVGSNALLKQKIYANLINKGFSKQSVKEVVDNLELIDEDNNLIKDINKYQRKYQNDYYKVYKKLLRLGYNSNKIKSLLKGEVSYEN